MGVEVEGFGFVVEGLRFGVYGSGIWGFGFRVLGLRFRVEGSGPGI